MYICRYYFKLDGIPQGDAQIALILRGKTVLNLEGETLAIVNLCMVRKSSKTSNFQGEGMYM